VEPILQVENLSVFYPDGTQALHEASLAVAPGQRVALLGANGAGKTSLQLAVMGGLHYHGKITLAGEDLSGGKAAKARLAAGMIFENPDDQLFMPTLLEDAAFGPLNQGCPAEQAQQRARQALADVGLAGFEGRAGHHLSAGQKRNASLATVLAMSVQLLLLDEPTAGLDGRSRRRLLELLKRRPEAMLVASHDLDFVGKLCSHVILLDAGKVAAAGEAGAILADAALLEKHGLV
jgi:cobalt/nickel transport system ATP-binding protein